MVGEMRARVRTLEQKINRVPLPKIRNGSLRRKMLGASKENANGWNPESGAESPGWVIVAEGQGTGKDAPSPSPLPRQPLVERGERKRTSFSSDRSSRKSMHEEPPPSAFRGMPTPSPSQQDFPTSVSGRTTPASTVGSNRVIARSGNGRNTPSSIFGMTIRRPQSRNASHGGNMMAAPLPSIPSLSRIPSSPLPGSADLSNDDYFFPNRPTTPSSSMTMLPMPVDRSPSKSEQIGNRRPARRLSLHPSGHHGAPGLGSATTPALPAGLTGGGSASVSGKPISPPRKSMSPSASAGIKMSPPGKKSPGTGMGASQSMLGMSRIGRPSSFGLASSRIGAPATAATKDKAGAGAAGRTRSGSVGWGRER
ncbi:hypothetical protein RhiJN_13057 [Ceratobasidium sp. AG-Ba]|nr:hypothetical protein RhiJN_13057 [Ceratobasidium sp. AG-Ba]